MVLTTLVLLTFLPLFAFLDRWCGGGLGWEKLSHDGGGPLRGRGIHFAFYGLVAFYLVLALPAIIAGFTALVALPGLIVLSVWAAVKAFPFVAVALSGFIFWRTPGWSFLFGGSMNPRTKKEIVGTFLRHSIVVPWLAGAVYLGLAAPTVIVAGLLFAGAATWLSIQLAKGHDEGEDNNDTVELNRGAVYGGLMTLAMAAGLFIPS